MITAVRYPILVRCALVAGVFSVIVGVLITLDFVGRGKYELFDAPAYLTLKEQLRERPGDEELRLALRDLDLHLRESYFRNRRFLATGMYLLLGGVILTLVLARWAAAQQGAVYYPPPVDAAADTESAQRRYTRWAAVGVVAALTGVLCGVAMRLDPIAPGDAPPSAAAQLSESVMAAGPAAAGAVAVGAESGPGGEPVSATLPAYDAYLQHWPRFRGPTGSGAVTFPEIPTQWSVPDNEGLLWKTAVPLPGHNSPVVWEQRVFLSGATETEQAVFCFDADSGSLVWRHDVPPTPPQTGELDVMDATGYAAPTTAMDGLRVYAIFATGDVVAVSLDGQRQWHKYLGLPKNPYGHASSLATYEDLVIVQWDQGSAQAGLSRLIALRGATGEVAWEVPREVPASWASPIVVRHEGRWMVIVAVNPWLIAYSPADGQELWRAKCLGGEVGPSPVFVDGVAYAANEMGGFAAVRADGSGDVTDTHVVWTTDIGVPDVCSPLVTDRFVLLISHGLLACFDREPADADPGDSEPREPLWEEDLLEEVSSSPSQVGDLIYLFSEEGKAWILRPGADACERLAELEMGEPVKASPAFQPGRMYVRGHDHLFCIGTR